MVLGELYLRKGKMPDDVAGAVNRAPLKVAVDAFTFSSKQTAILQLNTLLLLLSPS
jgi:hypothetical protein